MNNFKALVEWLKHAITENEQFHLGYADEASEFVRFNHAKVRQAGQVQQASLNLKLINDGRHADLGITLAGEPELDRQRLAEDMKMANLLGINTNNVIALTFVIGAALAAVAAVLISVQYGVINPNAGFLVGLKAFTAAVLGGIGSIPGAMLGGLVLGVAEAFGADIFGDQYKDVVAFGLLVLVLLFRPTGILGRPEIEKV